MGDATHGRNPQVGVAGRRVANALTKRGARVMAKKPRRSAAESRAKLIQAAREEFRRFGFSGATTAAIARSAGTSEAHLFRHFPNKAELFRESVFQALDEHFTAFSARHAAEMEKGTNVRQQARLYITELQAFLREHS